MLSNDKQRSCFFLLFCCDFINCNARDLNYMLSGVRINHATVYSALLFRGEYRFRSKNGCVVLFLAVFFFFLFMKRNFTQLTLLICFLLFCCDFINCNARDLNYMLSGVRINHATVYSALLFRGECRFRSKNGCVVLFLSGFFGGFFMKRNFTQLTLLI